MVEKVVEKMGYFGGKKEEEEGVVVDVMVVVVVGMEEEMEGRMVEELVVEMEGRVAGQGRQGGCLCCCSWPVVGWKWRRKKGNMKEREKGGGYIYIWRVWIITTLPSLKMSCVS